MAKQRNQLCKTTILSAGRGRNWGKSMADKIASTAKRRNRLRMRRGVAKAKATAATTAVTTKAAEKRYHQSCTLDRLPPQVLLMGILSTLSVKSLLQLKFLCKSFYSLISDTYFVETQFNRSITSPNLLRQRQHILFRYDYLMQDHYPYAFTLEAAADGDGHGDIVASPVKMDYMFESKKLSFNSCTIIGSCHGLLCSKFRRTDFYVSNLSTKESKRIPEPEVKFCFWDDFCVMGFGYDHSVDDYKLVAADKKSFYVYSLRTDSWKKVQGLPNSHKNIDKNIPVVRGVLLNGAIHWIYDDDCGSRKIVAFCLADEKFWEFPDPIPSIKVIHSLGLLGGCLCITPFNGGAFWVMKEYGVAQSWTKVAIEIPSYRIQLLTLLENHEAIFKIDSEKLVLYNAREKTYRDLVLRNFPDVKKIKYAGAYVESIVSPCHGSLS